MKNNFPPRCESVLSPHFEEDESGIILIISITHLDMQKSLLMSLVFRVLCKRKLIIALSLIWKYELQSLCYPFFYSYSMSVQVLNSPNRHLFHPQPSLQFRPVFSLSAALSLPHLSLHRRQRGVATTRRRRWVGGPADADRRRQGRARPVSGLCSGGAPGEPDKSREGEECAQ